MDNQILTVVFNVSGSVQLDLARAIEDPWWERITRGLDLDDPEQLQQAVRMYVETYLSNEELLSDSAPWTCGPASLYSVKAEVKNGGTASDSTSV